MGVTRGKDMFRAGTPRAMNDDELPSTDTADARGRLMQRARNGDKLAKEALRRHNAAQAAEQVRGSGGVDAHSTSSHVID